MKTNYALIIFIEILAFISISFWAAAMEGPIGGIFGQKEIYGFNADFYIFFMTVPLFLLIPIIIKPEIKLFGTLLGGYLIGIALEDFFWFVINPYYGVQKFNSHYAFWILHWVRIGNIEFPFFYMRYVLGGILALVIIAYKSERITRILKKFIRKYWI
jgi:hypothetical protein